MVSTCLCLFLCFYFYYSRLVGSYSCRNAILNARIVPFPIRGQSVWNFWWTKWYWVWCTFVYHPQYYSTSASHAFCHYRHNVHLETDNITLITGFKIFSGTSVFLCHYFASVLYLFIHLPPTLCSLRDWERCQQKHCCLSVHLS